MRKSAKTILSEATSIVEAVALHAKHASPKQAASWAKALGERIAELSASEPTPKVAKRGKARKVETVEPEKVDPKTTGILAVRGTFNKAINAARTRKERNAAIKAYVDAASKLDGTEVLNSKGKAYTFNFDADFETALAETAATAIGFGGITAELSGSWTWVGGDTKTVKDLLNDAGFRYSGKRKQWFRSTPIGYVKTSRFETVTPE